MPLCPGERSSQPGEKRQGRDRVDRREERSEILADLDQKRRHMSERVFYPDTDAVSSTSKVVALSIARNRTRGMIFPIHAFLSRHSFSTRRSLVRRLVSVGGSLIRMADQARGKGGSDIPRILTPDYVPFVYKREFGTLQTLIDRSQK